MQRLKFERVRLGVSQSTLATAAGMHQPVVAQIERGRLNPTPQQLERLGKALGIAPDDLLRDVEMAGSR